MGRRSRGLLFVVALAACDVAHVLPGDDTSDATTSDATDDACAFCHWDGSYDAGPPQIVVDPPDVACIDAGEGGVDCPLPPSVCAGSSLEYFDDGICVGGHCHYTVLFHACEVTCVDAGCVEIPRTNAP